MGHSLGCIQISVDNNLHFKPSLSNIRQDVVAVSKTIIETLKYLLITFLLLIQIIVWVFERIEHTQLLGFLLFGILVSSCLWRASVWYRIHLTALCYTHTTSPTLFAWFFITHRILLSFPCLTTEQQRDPLPLQ